MSQSAIQVSESPPLPGLALVQQLNAALETLATDFSGSTDPASFAKPFSTWIDTSGTPVLKRRNAANTAWVSVGDPFQTNAAASQITAGTIRLSNTTEAAALTDSASAISPATLKAAFGGVNAGSAWQRLPNGFIIQGGTNSATGDSSFSFPIAFPTQIIAAVASPYGDPAGNAVVIGVDNLALGTMSIRRRLVQNGGTVGGATFPAAWLAIGK